MKKILYLVTQSEWGGAQVYIRDLATHLPKNEFDVLVAAGNGDGELFTKLEKKGIRTVKLKHTVRSINPIKEVLAIYELVKLIKKEKPDVIHLNSSKIGVTGSIAARISSIIYHLSFITIYTSHGWVFNEPLVPIIKGLYFILEKWTAPLKNIIITVSEFDRQVALDKNIGNKNKLITINNGINQKNFLNKNTARQELAKYVNHDIRYMIRDTRYVTIGTIANLYATKGLKFLIKAASILKSDYPDLLFYIIGEGSERKNLESSIRKHNLTNNFFLLGKIDQAYKYLKAFDIFVLPSVKEGWPYTLLEALQAGLPSVSTKVGGIPEIITDDQNGLLTKPANPNELAQEISLLLRDENFTSDIKTGALNSSKKFNLQNTLDKTFSLYR